MLIYLGMISLDPEGPTSKQETRKGKCLLEKAIRCVSSFIADILKLSPKQDL